MTQRHRVLAALRNAGEHGVTNAQFIDMRITRFSARVEELRDAGYSISTERVSQGTFRYRLLSSPQAPETGVGANQEPVHRSWVDDATPIPVCGAERLFESEQPSETVSAVTGKRAA